MIKLFETKFGSHLYGTNNEKSDLDFKGVFIADLDDIILKKDRHVIIENTKLSTGARNSAGDTDIEYKELREFLKEAMAGQTYALDMLFSSRNMWTHQSPEWLYIVENRHRLLSKNVKPFLGYIRQQTAKYGLKGSRLAELSRIISYYEQFKETERLQDHPLPTGSEYVTFHREMNQRPHGLDPIMVEYMEVLGKKFQYSTKIKDMLGPLRRYNEQYGERAKMAATNEGVDWKAVSHAFRCCFELIELANKQCINFPLAEREFIKNIKEGRHDWLTLQDDLSAFMDEAFTALEHSALPAEPDREFWNKFILRTYKKYFT